MWRPVGRGLLKIYLIDITCLFYLWRFRRAHENDLTRGGETVNFSGTGYRKSFWKFEGGFEWLCSTDPFRRHRKIVCDKKYLGDDG